MSAMGIQKPGKARAWIMAARPATLPAAVAPVVVGTAVAVRAHHFQALPFLAALVAALLIQIGANFANDYFDFQKGADTTARRGPTRVTQSGIFTPRQVARATAVAFGLAVLVGLYLVIVGGWPILAVGLASIAAAILYTGGPFPFGYYGLGDLFVFIFFGVVAVSGTYYVQAGAVSWPAFVASIPMGLLITAILVANNIRDLETDRAAGKRTLAVRLGRQATRREYALCLGISYLVPPFMWLFHACSWLFWLPLLTAPLAYRLNAVVATHEDGPALIGVLKRTGLLQMAFGFLFAIALIVP